MTDSPDILLPRVTWDNLLPPYTDYDYFNGARRFPFEHDASGFSLTNAWWLAETAALVYADKNFISPRLERVGFGNLLHLSGNSTDCFVASNDHAALVVFRGTELRPRGGRGGFRPVLADIIADVNLRWVPSVNCGRVHNGFQNALDEIWADLLACLEAFHHKNCPVWVAGHSLGAALATLAIDRFPGARALYAYGSPQVGDSDFANNFSAEAYRFVFGNDIITRLPPGSDYQHVGELHAIGDSEPGRKVTREDTDPENHRTFDLHPIGRIFDQVGAGISEMVPASLRDHVPVLYSAQLRRELEAGPVADKIQQTAITGPE